MTTLRERMIREMQLRNFSPATQRNYLYAVAGLARHFNRPPDQLGTRHVEDYLLHLLQARKLAAGSCHAMLTAIRFFFLVTLGRDPKTLPLPPLSTSHRLPEILSHGELQRLFGAAPSGKHRVLLMTTYSAGLRVSEVIRLKPSDIHADRMLIRVVQGKGRKDRYSLLASRILKELRTYWKNERPHPWFFPGQKRHCHMGKRMAQTIYSTALRKASLQRGGGIHTLRHCFATHLMEAGFDIRIIQDLMGHRSILTTMRYLQVTRKNLDGTKSPLDLLSFPRELQLP